MREVPKIYIFYSGFVSRGGGVVTHLKVVEKALKRLEPNIVVKAYSLDNLKPFSYLLVVIERFINLLAFPAGFILRALLSKFLWQTIVFFKKKNNNYFLFEDIYTSPQKPGGKHFLTFLHALKSDQLYEKKPKSSSQNILLNIEKRTVARINPVTVSYEYASWVTNRLQLPIKVIPLGSFPEEYHIGPKENWILIAGNLEARKNPFFALETIKILAMNRGDFQAFFTGRGPLEIQLKKQIGNDPKIKVLGWIPKKELTDLFSRAKILLLPSKQETFGLVLLEAKYSGCFTIASEGLTVPKDLTDLRLPLDPRLWAQKISETLDNYSPDPKEREKIISKYNAIEMANQILKEIGYEGY